MEQTLVLPKDRKTKKVLISLGLDLFFWTYTLLVTYKVIYQKVILNLRFVEFSWTQPFYALVIGFIVSLVSFKTPLSLGKVLTGFSPLDKDTPLTKNLCFWWGAFILIITFVAGLYISQVSIREFLSPSGLNGAKRIFGALFNPNFAILEPALFSAVETIYMAFIATIVALPIAFLIAFAAARNLMNSSRTLLFVYSCVRFFLNLTRSIEPLVWAIIFSVWVGIGPFAGMLALCLHSISSLSKLYSEQIENIDDGPIEAITATGAHPFQVIWYGVVPQIVLPYLSFTIYRWDINVRMATVIGLVGGGGIGTMLMQYQGLAKWNEVGLLVIIIAVIVWVMDYTSSRIREAIK